MRRFLGALLLVACSSQHEAAVDAGAETGVEAAVDADVVATTTPCAIPSGAAPEIHVLTPPPGARCTRIPFVLDAPRDVVETSDGAIYVTEMHGGRIARLDPSGFVVVASGLSSPIGIREENASTLLFVEEGASGQLSRLDRATGAITHVASGLGSSTYLTLRGAAAYVSTFSSLDMPTAHVMRVDLVSAAVAPFATGLSVPEGLFFEGDRMVVNEWFGSRVLRFPSAGGDASGAIVVADGFDALYGAVSTPSGIVVADTSGRVVRLRDGKREDLLGDVAAPAGLAWTKSGDLLIVEHGGMTHDRPGYVLRLSGL